LPSTARIHRRARRRGGVAVLLLAATVIRALACPVMTRRIVSGILKNTRSLDFLATVQDYIRDVTQIPTT
jgi:hypothetical protein